MQAAWPYLFDRRLFGVSLAGARVSAGEYFSRHHLAALDFVCDLAYLLYVYVVLALAFGMALAPGAARERTLGRRWLDVALLSFWALVAFSAVYLQHHYVLDCALGTAYAIAAWRAQRALSAVPALRSPPFGALAPGAS